MVNPDVDGYKTLDHRKYTKKTTENPNNIKTEI